MGATEEVARFVRGLSLDRVPAPAITAAKMAILDCVGVMLAGSREPVGRILQEQIKDTGGKPESAIIGSNFRAPAHEAALANGAAAHAMDYDDYDFMAGGHPSVTLVPAILALGEVRRISGREALEAYLAGFELVCRIGREVGRGLQSRGWHDTAVWGPLGAALAAAKVLKLSVEQTRTALSIATASAAGLRGNFGTMTKPLHAGKSAQWGIVAARLAERGLTAAEDILENPQGFFHGIGDGAKYEPQHVTADLGQTFLISETLAFKPYPSCGISHPSIDAVLFLVRQHNVRADEVAEVECSTGDTVPVTLRYHQPKTALEGKFSLEYCLAVAILDRQVALDQFTEERVADPALREMVTRVHYVHPADRRGWGAHMGSQKVTIRLRDGKQLSREVAVARGQPQNPLTAAELATKYRDCARQALTPESTERSLELLQKIEDLTDVSTLMQQISL